MIVDAHTHVWRALSDYPRPAVTTVSPVSDVPAELLCQYLAEHGVDRAVLVQPIYPGEDNSYVADCAAAQPDRFAAVCVVDPRSDGTADRLEYWATERGCKGLRMRPALDDEEASCGAPATFPLWERSRSLGVVVSVLGNPQHLPALTRLIRQFPEVAVVLDHLGHAAVEGGVAADAFRSLLGLAQFPRVFIKLSGFYYFSRQAYPFADCAGAVRALVDHFGASRLLWGSDFPHVLLKVGYQRTLRGLERACPFLSSADRQQIMGETARRLYWPRSGDHAFV